MIDLLLIFIGTFIRLRILADTTVTDREHSTMMLIAVLGLVKAIRTMSVKKGLITLSQIIKLGILGDLFLVDFRYGVSYLCIVIASTVLSNFLRQTQDINL